jgi:hypothetical protein
MATSTFTREGVQRILVGSMSALARLTLKDQDGTRVAAAGTLTANLQRADGTVLATGRATAPGVGTGAYTVTLTAAECATLDIIQVTWIDGTTPRATTFHRIVGGFLFGIDDLAAASGMSGVATTDLLRARDWITDVIEENTGTAWCPTYDVEQFIGDGCVHVLDVRPIRAVRSLTVDDVAQVVADVDVDEASGVISGVGMTGRCVIGYEHGYDAPPADLRDAAFEGARDRILRSSSGLSDRIRSVTNDLGVTQQFSYPGPGHPTGIDSVDAAIRAHDRRLVGMA